MEKLVPAPAPMAWATANGSSAAIRLSEPRLCWPDLLGRPVLASKSAATSTTREPSITGRHDKKMPNSDRLLDVCGVVLPAAACVYSKEPPGPARISRSRVFCMITTYNPPYFTYRTRTTYDFTRRGYPVTSFTAAAGMATGSRRAPALGGGGGGGNSATLAATTASAVAVAVGGGGGADEEVVGLVVGDVDGGGGEDF